MKFRDKIKVSETLRIDARNTAGELVARREVTDGQAQNLDRQSDGTFQQGATAKCREAKEQRELRACRAVVGLINATEDVSLLEAPPEPGDDDSGIDFRARPSEAQDSDADCLFQETCADGWAAGKLGEESGYKRTRTTESILAELDLSIGKKNRHDLGGRLLVLTATSSLPEELVDDLRKAATQLPARRVYYVPLTGTPIELARDGT